MYRYSMGLLFSEDKSKLALIKKIKPKWQEGMLNAIGGKIEADESAKPAMIREFKEETGVTIDSWREFCYLSGSDWHLFIFVAFSDEIYKVKTMEAEEVFIMDVDTLDYGHLMNNLKWIIPMALDKDNLHAHVTEQSNIV